MRTRLFLIAALFASLQTATANVIFVNASASGADNGSSWTDAFTDLQNGFAATLPGDSIWVAQGVYKPTATTNRAVSFVLPNGVKVFGGFTGSETYFQQRNYLANVTILSGDIGVTGNASDNTYNVIKTTTVASTTRLDGFKITLGNATNGSGGGLFNASGSPVIAHCIFEYNQSDDGAAISQFNNGGMTILDCTFRYNSANDNGGAIEVRDGSMMFSGCDFYSNIANLDGGAIYLYGGVTTLDRCRISGNSAAYVGGAIYGYYNSTLQMTNSLIVGNESTTSSAIYFPPLSNTNPHVVRNCTFADNKGAASGASDCVTLNANSEISNSIFYGNRDPREIYPLTGEVNYCLVDGGFTGSGANQIFNADPGFISPGSYLLAPFTASSYNYHVGVLELPVDAGNNTYLNPLYMLDLDSNPRVYVSLVDLGAYENNYCSFDLQLSVSGSVIVCPDSVLTVTALNGTSFLWSDSSTASAINILNPGTYTVHADSSGCLGSDSITVNYYNVLLSISGNPNLCNNDSTLLTATGNVTSFIWNTSAVTSSIFAYSAGTYFVDGTTANGCWASDTFLVSNVSGPTPVISYNSGILSTTTFTSYQWLMNGNPVAGAASDQYTPLQNGNYQVVVTNSFGCTDTSAVFVVNDVSVPELSAAAINVYPNPCTDKFMISGLDGFTLLEVYDNQGRILLSEQLSDCSSLEWNIAFLAPGSYVLRVSNESVDRHIPLLKK